MAPQTSLSVLVHLGHKFPDSVSPSLGDGELRSHLQRCLLPLGSLPSDNFLEAEKCSEWPILPHLLLSNLARGLRAAVWRAVHNFPLTSGEQRFWRSGAQIPHEPAGPSLFEFPKTCVKMIAVGHCV